MGGARPTVFNTGDHCQFLRTFCTRSGGSGEQVMMDQEAAKQLFFEGAVLVLLDVPEGTEFGIDYTSWHVGPRFKGIKMIPPGFHFVFYSAVNRHGQSAPRTGFFHFFKKQEVMVRCWNPETEDITNEGISDETVTRISLGLTDLDSNLGPYPYDSLKKWISLTNHISVTLVSRIQPLNGKISSVTQVKCEELKGRPDSTASTLQLAAEEPEASDEVSREKSDPPQVTPGGLFAGVGEFLPTLKEEADSKTGLAINYRDDAMLRFSEIPYQKYPLGATPAQISHHNIDLSYCLETLLTSHYHNDPLESLGELQFSFVCFLLGHVYDAFEHWKKLVNLLCCSEDALSTHKDLFIAFISVLHFQLKEIPEDFFVDIVSRNNFLTTTLQTFFSNLESAGGKVDEGLVKRGLQFRDHLTKKFKWDFSMEPNEYAPTVVHT